MIDASFDNAVNRVSRNLRCGSAIIVAVLGLTCASRAADMPFPVKAPIAMPMTMFSWTGFYIGGQVGYAWGRDSTTEYFTGTNTLTGIGWNYPVSGVVGGLYAGANYQIGSFVIGAEADIEGTNIKGGFYDTALGGSGDTQIRWQSSVRGRVGFAVDKVLFYGTGGVAFAEIYHSKASESLSAMRTGWTAGGGIEWALTPQVLVRAEYRYTDFGKYRYDSLVTFPGLTAEQTPAYSAMRVGAAYKF